jgi:hypothetical protein
VNRRVWIAAVLVVVGLLAVYLYPAKPTECDARDDSCAVGCP